MGVRSPFTPTLSPLEKGGRGCRAWGDVIPTNGKRDILSAPALWGEGAGGRYRLKRKSVSGNGIRSRGGVRRGMAHGCTIPPHPDPLPPFEGGRGCREWGDVRPTNGKKDILSAPAPQRAGALGTGRRPKRKFIIGNGITLPSYIQKAVEAPL